MAIAIPDSIKPRRSQRHGLRRLAEHLVDVGGGLEDGFEHPPLDLRAERLAVQGVRRQPVDPRRRLAEQVAEARSRHLRRGGGDGGRVGEDRDGGRGGEGRLHAPELHRGDARGVSVHRGGGGNAHEFTTGATRDVACDVGDHPGTDGDEHIGFGLGHRVSEAGDARLVGEQTATLGKTEGRDADVPVRQLVDDAPSDGLLGVRVHDDERSRPATRPDVRAELVDRALPEHDHHARGAVGRAAGATVAGIRSDPGRRGRDAPHARHRARREVARAPPAAGRARSSRGGRAVDGRPTRAAGISGAARPRVAAAMRMVMDKFP